MAAKVDPYAATAALIANAITTAKVLGEIPRITRLVVSTIGRFAAELDGPDDSDQPGKALLQYALTRISAADAPLVPKLHSGINKLLTGADACAPLSDTTTAFSS